MVESAGAFSSLISQETEDTMLLLLSEMAIVVIIAGGVMVGAVGTVAVGIVIGMVGGGMATDMEVSIAACTVMVGTVAGTVVEEEGMLAKVVESIGGRLGVGLRAPLVRCVELLSMDTEGTVPVLAFLDIWPTESLHRLVCIDDVSEDSLFTSTSCRRFEIQFG